MVCPRCIIVVEQLLSQQGLQSKNTLLGEVDLAEELTEQQLQTLAAALEEVGFEILQEPKRQMIDKIKTVVIQKVQQAAIERHFNLSSFITRYLLKDYSFLTKLFTECEHCTIEQFFILQKIEKAKELLHYNQLSVAEIAENLGYSSSQHFSSQFKKNIGLTPMQFKTNAALLRQPIDGIGPQMFKPIIHSEPGIKLGCTA